MTGSRACGAWPEPSSVTSCAARQLGERGARLVRGGSVVGAVDDEHGQRDARRELARRRLVERRRRACVAISVSASVSRPQPTQSSICLVECGSAKICEKKNSQEPAVVAQPVVALYLAQPSSVSSSSSNEPRARAPASGPSERHRRADEDGARDPLRVPAARCSAQLRAHASSPTTHGALGAGRVQDGQRVGRVLLLGVCRGLAGAVGPAVAAAVEGDRPGSGARGTGTCIFQMREWTIDQVGSSSTVGPPLPYTS